MYSKVGGLVVPFAAAVLALLVYVRQGGNYNTAARVLMHGLAMLHIDNHSKYKSAIFEVMKL